MEQLLTPGLVARDVIRSYYFSTQYQGIIGDLERWGFRESEAPPTLYVFPYDWRMPNEDSADKLAALLDKIAADHSQVNVTILGHSMGGLIARYYLESGKYAGRQGLARVDQLLTLGTPHRGAPVALIRILGHEKVLWLSAAQVKQAANHPLFPSAYQLLPPPGEPFTLDEDPGSQLAELDLYDPSVVSGLGLQQSSMEAAREFHAQLSPNKRPHSVRYFCFTGTQQRTSTLAMLKQDGRAYRVRRVEREESGDGTVPFWSGALPGFRALSVGGEHSVLYRNKDVRRVLATLLGASEAAGAVPLAHRERELTVEVSVRDRVIRPGTRVHLVLDASAGVSSLNGELRVERAHDPTAGAAQWVTVESLKVAYSGPDAETLGLVVDGPRESGAYRIAFYRAGSPNPVGSDEVFVQEDTPQPAPGI
jgi:pimeloyl-ACP methyl ester carboxylesterase